MRIIHRNTLEMTFIIKIMIKVNKRDGLPVETSLLNSRNMRNTPCLNHITWNIPRQKRRERNKPSNMAAKSLTEELHNLIFNENYTTTIELTDSSECINSSELYHLRKYVMKTCNLQTSSLIDKKGQAIPSGIFNYSSNLVEKLPDASETNC